MDFIVEFQVALHWLGLDWLGGMGPKSLCLFVYLHGNLDST